QGTAWDPQSKYMATQSSDRSCRVYQITQDGGGGSGSSGAGRVAVKCCNVIKSGGGDKGNEDACATGVDSTKDKTKPVQRKNLFVDETVTSFFRRLSWSPDGAFLITP
ncbi:unnamed protein product, partial [Ectocarpus fasciculatus]